MVADPLTEALQQLVQLTGHANEAAERLRESLYRLGQIQQEIAAIRRLLLTAAEQTPLPEEQT